MKGKKVDYLFEIQRLNITPLRDGKAPVAAKSPRHHHERITKIDRTVSMMATRPHYVFM